MARLFKYGELPLVLLALLEQRPMSGYELMGELGRLFSPAYRPSPGSVYPALRNLAEERLIRERTSNGAATFAPTARGLRALGDRGAELAELEVRTGRRVRSRPDLEADLAQFVEQVRHLAPRLPLDVVRVQLEEAVTRLRSAITDNREGSGTSHG